MAFVPSNGIVSRFRYSGSGLLLAEEHDDDDDGVPEVVIAYQYDDAGRLTHSARTVADEPTQDLSVVTKYGDDGMRPERSDWFRGEVLAWTSAYRYDERGRVTSEVGVAHPRGEWRHSFSYDEAGRLVREAQEGSVERWANFLYDDRDELEAVEWGDADGLLATIEHRCRADRRYGVFGPYGAGGVLSAAFEAVLKYDERGLLVAVDGLRDDGVGNPQPFAWQFNYDANGYLVSTGGPDSPGPRREYFYDCFDWEPGPAVINYVDPYFAHVQPGALTLTWRGHPSPRTVQELIGRCTPPHR